MKNSFAFFFLLLVSASSDLIQESCDKAAHSSPNIQSDFCVAGLRGNPSSRTATSLEALVPVSIDIAISNATSIRSLVSQLLENKNLENYTRSCLEDCSELYSDAGSDLKDGSQAVKSKDYETASSVISAGMDAPDTCEKGFAEKEGSVSPLTKENANFFQLTAISLAFVAMLK